MSDPKPTASQMEAIKHWRQIVSGVGRDHFSRTSILSVTVYQQTWL
ncbi:MAG TPA: hypothetical protein VJ124_09635 [Pyrinomonadaceae bacterium]|nr:hypothetical protein [Pyrinomonadaceae bacterium]